MKQVLNRIQFSRFLSITVLLVLQLISFSSFSQNATANQDGDPFAGKQLFNQNCAACHALDRKFVGPALLDVQDRLAKDEGLGKEWFYKWIRNSSELIASGDAYAKKTFEANGQIPMLPFPALTDKEIDDILAYTVPESKRVSEETSDEASESADENNDDAIAASGGSADGDSAKGKQLFNQNCAACHALDRKMTGPALANVEARLSESKGLGKEWLYKWIKNSAGMIASGDAYANEVYNEFNQSAMTAFPTLSNEDIDNILAYTAAPPKTTKKPIETDVAVGGSGDSGSISNEIILGALALVFGILVVMLFLVNNTLKRIAEANGVQLVKEAAEKRTPIWKAFAKNQFLIFCTVIVFLLGSAYFAYSWLSQIGIDQGYAPVQPIHYSHRIHAGVNKIECQYCHSSARVSKHSGIPSLNVCMNCHKNINQYSGAPDGSSIEGDLAAGYSNEFYTKEIKKLYKAVGWDEDNQQYTGESQPVEWVRIHNLPDFAYFNHSQHVSVGKIECQTCHGPVEEMEVMYQYSPLTMGWCINCHRETEVKVADNEYYEKIHTELSKKYGVEKLTAAQMGGLECGKCHY